MSIFSPKQSFVLVFDIASGSVGGSFFLKNEEGVPLIIETRRIDFPLRELPDTDRMKLDLLDSLDTLCADLQRKVGRRPDKIFCVLSTPWAHGELRSIKFASTGFVFTEKFAGKLIDDETLKFKEEWQNLKVIIDKRTVKISLNGYAVDNPHGERARSLEIGLYLSLAEEDLVKKIEEKIHRIFKAKIAFTSQMFSDFICVRDIFDLRNDFIILNVGEEVSEVTLMKDDHLIGTAFFPYGKASVVRYVSENLGKSMRETKSLFSLLSDGFIDEKLNKKFLEALGGAGASWIKELKTILHNLLPERHLPHNIFLASDEKTDEWLESFLSIAKLPEFTLSSADFDVIIGGNKTLHGFADFRDGATRDPSLTMKTIFINHL